MSGNAATVLSAGTSRCARDRFTGASGPHADHAWHLFPIVLNEQAPISRNRFIEILAEKGVGTSVHYKPLHRMTYYRDRYSLRPDDYPNAERTWRGCASLPIYPSLTDEDLADVCRAVKATLNSRMRRAA